MSRPGLSLEKAVTLNSFSELKQAFKGHFKYYEIVEEWTDHETAQNIVKCTSPRFAYDKTDELLADFIRDNPEEVIRNNVLYLHEFLSDELGADLCVYKPDGNMSSAHIYDYAIRHNGESYVLSDLRNYSKPVSGDFPLPTDVLEFLLNTEKDRLASDPYYAKQGEKIITTQVINITTEGWEFLDSFEEPGERTKAFYDLKKNPKDYPDYIEVSFEYESSTTANDDAENQVSAKGAEELAKVLDDLLQDFSEGVIDAKELKNEIQSFFDDYRNKYKIGRVFSEKLMATFNTTLNVEYLRSAITDVCAEWEVKIKAPSVLIIDFPETSDIHYIKYEQSGKNAGKYLFQYYSAKTLITRYYYPHQIMWRCALNVFPKYYIELMHYAETNDKFSFYDVTINEQRLRTIGDYDSPNIMHDSYKLFRKEILDDVPAYSSRANNIVAACEMILSAVGVVNPLSLIFGKDVAPKARVNDLVTWYESLSFLYKKDGKTSLKHKPQHLFRGLIRQTNPMIVEILEGNKPTGNLIYPTSGKIKF